MAKKCGKIGMIICVITIVTVVIIILVAKSISTIEYYQYGFKKHVTKNVVDRSEAFGPGGMETFGPTYTFLPLPSSAQFVAFNKVSVWAKDRLEVIITAQIQYFLRKDQIGLLHKKFDVNFADIIYSNALSALKNKAPMFETREYLRDRARVEEELFSAIREHISGKCCESGCQDTLSCIPGCKVESCTESDFGFFVDVRYFQLGALDLHDGLRAKFLRTQVLYEEANIEGYKQDAAIQRKEADAEVKEIQNEARGIKEDARSQSKLIISEANANATAILEDARTEGLQYLYTILGITDIQQKASFDYIRSLGKNNNVKLAVNFEQLRLNGN